MKFADHKNLTQNAALVSFQVPFVIEPPVNLKLEVVGTDSAVHCALLDTGRATSTSPLHQQRRKWCFDFLVVYLMLIVDLSPSQYRKQHLQPSS